MKAKSVIFVLVLIFLNTLSLHAQKKDSWTASKRSVLELLNQHKGSGLFAAFGALEYSFFFQEGLSFYMSLKGDSLGFQYSELKVNRYRLSRDETFIRNNMAFTDIVKFGYKEAHTIKSFGNEYVAAPQLVIQTKKNEITVGFDVGKDVSVITQLNQLINKIHTGL